MKIREQFIPLPVTRVVELSIDLMEDWDGSLDSIDLPPDAKGASVKPLVHISEDRLAELDRTALMKRILAFGASACRLPVVQVSRRREKRDERHASELSLEESLTIFAEEVRSPEPEERVAFAVALAREADAGVLE